MEPNSFGIVPSNLLYERSRAGGIDPFKKLVFRLNHNNLLQFPNSPGMLPERELFASSRMVRSDKRPNEVERSKYDRTLKLNSGIFPLRLVFFNTRLSKFSRLCKKEETKPKSMLSIVFVRFIEETLDPLHVMPVKLQGFVEDDTQF
nr:hypothetical protein Iba_scaffold486331CG0010 [Ipomoea batatas]